MRMVLALAALALMITATGCGKPSATVSGAVSFNGEPVAEGSISLLPADGKGSPAGADILKGRYTLSNVTPGEKIVQLTAPVVVGTTKDDYGGETKLVEDLMPVSWGRASREKISVSAGSTTQDFAIEGPDPRKKK